MAGKLGKFWGLLLLMACKASQPEPPDSAIQALSQPAQASGFAKALKPRPFRFPADDGPHPEFQTEWWYLTGHLETSQQRHFGYQLTFFRRGLQPGQAAEQSWPTRQIWFAHLALSDPQSGKFYAFERWQRQSIGLAGAQPQPFKVWLDNWFLRGDPEHALQLYAQEQNLELNLSLAALKPVVLHGRQGLSQKSAGQGNASYYYSRSRMQSQGRLSLNGQSFEVKGLSWMDREWSTSVLSAQQSGWDWFSLQFADGRELMLYQLRLKGGGIDSHSSGSLIAQSGQLRHLSHKDFVIRPLSHWRSPHSGVNYPASWRLEVPAAGLSLRLEPWQPDQELTLSLRYWEGAVKVLDADSGQLLGQGFVELTGYTP